MRSRLTLKFCPLNGFVTLKLKKKQDGENIKLTMFFEKLKF